MDDLPIDSTGVEVPRGHDGKARPPSDRPNREMPECATGGMPTQDDLVGGLYLGGAHRRSWIGSREGYRALRRSVGESIASAFGGRATIHEWRSRTLNTVVEHTTACGASQNINAAIRSTDDAIAHHKSIGGRALQANTISGSLRTQVADDDMVDAIHGDVLTHPVDRVPHNRAAGWLGGSRQEVDTPTASPFAHRVADDGRIIGIVSNPNAARWTRVASQSNGVSHDGGRL